MSYPNPTMAYHNPVAAQQAAAMPPAAPKTSWFSNPENVNALIYALGSTGAALAPDDSWQRRLGATAASGATAQQFNLKLKQQQGSSLVNPQSTPAGASQLAQPAAQPAYVAPNGQTSTGGLGYDARSAAGALGGGAPQDFTAAPVSARTTAPASGRRGIDLSVVGLSPEHLMALEDEKRATQRAMQEALSFNQEQALFPYKQRALQAQLTEAEARAGVAGRATEAEVKQKENAAALSEVDLDQANYNAQFREQDRAALDQERAAKLKKLQLDVDMAAFALSQAPGDAARKANYEDAQLNYMTALTNQANARAAGGGEARKPPSPSEISSALKETRAAYSKEQSKLAALYDPNVPSPEREAQKQRVEQLGARVKRLEALSDEALGLVAGEGTQDEQAASQKELLRQMLEEMAGMFGPTNP